MIYRKKFANPDLMGPKDIKERQINHILSLYGRLGEMKGELRLLMGLWHNEEYASIIALSRQPAELGLLVHLQTNGKNSPKYYSEVSQREEAATEIYKKIHRVSRLVDECKQNVVANSCSFSQELASLETLCDTLSAHFLGSMPVYNTPEGIKLAMKRRKIP